MQRRYLPPYPQFSIIYPFFISFYCSAGSYPQEWFWVVMFCCPCIGVQACTVVLRQKTRARIISLSRFTTTSGCESKAIKSFYPLFSPAPSQHTHTMKYQRWQKGDHHPLNPSISCPTIQLRSNYSMSLVSGTWENSVWPISLWK
jgi:hypothetical protein